MKNGHLTGWVGSTPGEATRVSTFEMFFDLVFVFAVTQLTDILVHRPDLQGVLRMTLVLGVVWWMYGGYAWLTNAVPPTDLASRLLILVGMAGFLVIALAIPEAFGDSGLVFGIGYLIVTVVHLALFVRSAEERTVLAVLRLAPFNLLSAGLLFAAGFGTGNADWALWSLAFLLQWVTPYLSKISGFAIRPAHFVERHGMVVIIVLGESLISVVIGVAGRPVAAGEVLVAVLGLGLTAALWWVFFAGSDDERALESLERAADDRRPWIALQAFGYGYLPVLGGVVLLAAGNKIAIAHIAEPASWAGALFTAGGVSLYLAGDCLYRARLGFGPNGYRAWAAVAVLFTAPLGHYVSAEAQLATLLAMLVSMLLLEARGLRKDAE